LKGGLSSCGGCKAIKVKKGAHEQSAEEEVAVYKQNMENYLKKLRKETKNDDDEDIDE
jgi:hypothetical protein